MVRRILLISCPDRPGLVATVAGWVASHGGNILDLDHHTDEESRWFFLRALFVVPAGGGTLDDLAREFSGVAESHSMTASFRDPAVPVRTGILVSKYDHCLVDLLLATRHGDLPMTIPLVISNHETVRPWADLFQIPFVHLPVAPETKPQQEAAVAAELRRVQVSLVVLARYMQILSDSFLSQVGCPVINVHHSFLPAFIGSKPYHQAFDRGVKMIGATAHYATTELDEGPIIDQETLRVSHRDGVPDLVRKGRDIERQVLTRAVRAHVNHRVLAWRGKTIVFDE